MMNIEITGTSIRNKGAELMLVAIQQHFQKHHPDVRLAVDRWFGTYADRARYGLWLKEDFTKWGRARISMALMPNTLKDSLGFISDQNVSVILDASGFAFGDQHPYSRTIGFAEKVERAKKDGKTVILLPQAFGPFEQPGHKQGMHRICVAADLIFARDEISLAHLQNAAEGQGNIKMAPDFTNLVKPVLNIRSEESNRVCIVPNDRMIEKAKSGIEEEAYIALIVKSVELTLERGLEPVILVHSKPDQQIAQLVLNRVGKTVTLIEEHDPVLIKQIIGESRLVIASRFHALVSALSQGVPAIGTSWSHKYQLLFQNYQCRDMLFDTSSDFDKLSLLMEIGLGVERERLVAKLNRQGDTFRNQSQDMWNIIDSMLTSYIG